jgi:small subunit ribosomal protein S2
MLTNFQTVNKRLQRLKELEEIDFEDVAASGVTKKELLMKKREKDKLERTLGGVRNMSRVPSAVWVVDTKKEHLAVKEARKLGIPVIAILDTNCDPDEVDFPIPGNDDAIRAVALLTRVVADGVADGLIAREGQKADDDTTGAELATDEPLPEWEKELLTGSADAAEQDGTASQDATAAATDAAPSDTAAATDGAATDAAAIAAAATDAPAEPAATDAAPETVAADDATEPAVTDAAPETVAADDAAEPAVTDAARETVAADDATEAAVTDAAPETVAVDDASEPAADDAKATSAATA